MPHSQTYVRSASRALGGVHWASRREKARVFQCHYTKCEHTLCLIWPSVGKDPWTSQPAHCRQHYWWPVCYNASWEQDLSVSETKRFSKRILFHHRAPAVFQHCRWSYSAWTVISLCSSISMWSSFLWCPCCHNQYIWEVSFNSRPSAYGNVTAAHLQYIASQAMVGFFIRLLMVQL